MLPKFFPLRTLVAAIAMASILLAITVAAADNGQEIDMSQLTCEEFVQMDRMGQLMSTVWYSGWFAQNQGNFMFTPDRGVMSERKDSLEAACENNGNDLVVNQLQN